MFITEYDEAVTMEKFRKEYLAQGLSQGDRQRMESVAWGMYEEGMDLDIIARVLKTTVEEVDAILGLKKT